MWKILNLVNCVVLGFFLLLCYLLGENKTLKEDGILNGSVDGEIIKIKI